MEDKSGKKKVFIDLNYLKPDTTFVYPIYADDGKKLLNKRELLTGDLIKRIIEKYGSKVFYYYSDYENGLIPEMLLGRAFAKTKELIDESIYRGKFSKEAFQKSEELVDEILEELSDRELSAVNLLKDMKKHDDYLYYHAVNVGILSALLVKKRRKYSRNEIKYVVLGAYLSDLGKVKIDRGLLNKPEKLTPEEFITMKMHPQFGYEMLKSIDGIDPIVFQTVLFHHERLDEKGYYSLPYDSLPSSPKVVSICDTYDALTSPKPYRQSYSSHEALKIILNLTDQKFERALVSDFINSMGILLNHSQNFYRKGDFCILNTHEIAVVTEQGVSDVLKPRVMVFAKYVKENGRLSMRFFQNPIEVDLLVDPNRLLQNIVVNQKVIDAIRERLVSKKMLVDYLYNPIDD